MPIPPQAQTRLAPAAWAFVINLSTFFRRAALVSLSRPPNLRPPTFSWSVSMAIYAMAFSLRPAPSSGPRTYTCPVPLAIRAPSALPSSALAAYAILGGLPPMPHLLREQPPLPAVGTELSLMKASRLHHHRELVVVAPALWFLLRCRHHRSL
jgi:hypothetical protein